MTDQGDERWPNEDLDLEDDSEEEASSKKRGKTAGWMVVIALLTGFKVCRRILRDFVDQDERSEAVSGPETRARRDPFDRDLLERAFDNAIDALPGDRHDLTPQDPFEAPEMVRLPAVISPSVHAFFEEHGLLRAGERLLLFLETTRGQQGAIFLTDRRIGRYLETKGGSPIDLSSRLDRVTELRGDRFRIVVEGDGPLELALAADESGRLLYEAIRALTPEAQHKHTQSFEGPGYAFLLER